MLENYTATPVAAANFSLSKPMIISSPTKMTGTPICPLFSIISCLFSMSEATLCSVYETLFCVKNSFAIWQKWQVGVLYMVTCLSIDSD